MNKLLILPALICGFVNLTFAQQRNDGGVIPDVRISKDQPTVYLSFVRTGKVKPYLQGESGERVWLRLHNNTKWPIILKVAGVQEESYGEVGMFYGIEDKPKPRMEVVAVHKDPSLNVERPNSEGCKVPFGVWCHVCRTTELAPGGSLLFSVPREHLCTNLRIYLLYNYVWEQRGELSSVSNEPQHRVYFSGEDIPKQAR